MATALTHPFINENDEVTKDFLIKVSDAKKTDELKVRSRIVPTINRRTVGVSVLREAQPVVFDADNQDHLRAWALFHTTGRWHVRFVLELPWDNVPQMILDKMNAQHAGAILAKTKDRPLTAESIQRVKVSSTLTAF